MGYTADAIQIVPITIEAENAKKFIDSLRPYESRIGHISWCRVIDEYVKSYANDENDNFYLEVVNEMMDDFGFITQKTDESVILVGWQGDKIGSSWDDVWVCLATVSRDDALWAMRGEDGAMWGERISSGVRTVVPINIVAEL